MTPLGVSLFVMVSYAPLLHPHSSPHPLRTACILFNDVPVGGFGTNLSVPLLTLAFHYYRLLLLVYYLYLLKIPSSPVFIRSSQVPSSFRGQKPLDSIIQIFFYILPPSPSSSSLFPPSSFYLLPSPYFLFPLIYPGNIQNIFILLSCLSYHSSV